MKVTLECPHQNFSAKVQIERMGMSDNSTRYFAGIDVVCKDCGTEFEWFLPAKPKDSIREKIRLRMPLRPARAAQIEAEIELVDAEPVGGTQ
jgi:hypothetical protein